MNKRIIITLMLLAATAARAFDFKVATATGQEVYYSIVDDTTVRVVNPGWGNYTQPTGFLALPSTVEYDGTSYRVTAIDAQAFRSCSGLTGVAVPEGVTSIGRMAFAFCAAIDSIVLPTTLMEIGSQAFTGTAYYSSNAHLTDEGLLFIGPYLIASRPSIKGALVVPEGTLGLGNMALYSCDSIDHVTLPATLRFIGENAFGGCLALDTLAIHATVPPTLQSNSFQDVPAFVVTVPCGHGDAYRAAAHWSLLTLEEDCNSSGIADSTPDAQFTATAVEGGLRIMLPEGHRLCTVSDLLGRRVATVRNDGFVPLKNPGVYLVGNPTLGKTIKVIFAR